MKYINQPNKSIKKEPLPDQEQTASSVSNLPPIKKRARQGTQQWRNEEIASLRARLIDPKYHLRQLGILYTKEWRKVLGRGTCYQLLGVLMRTCNWRKRRWHGNEYALAGVMGVKERTIRYQLAKLKKIDGFAVHKHPWSYTIFLPERIFPKDKDYGKGYNERQ